MRRLAGELPTRRSAKRRWRLAVGGRGRVGRGAGAEGPTVDRRDAPMFFILLVAERLGEPTQRATSAEAFLADNINELRKVCWNRKCNYSK